MHVRACVGLHVTYFHGQHGCALARGLSSTAVEASSLSLNMFFGAFVAACLRQGPEQSHFAY